jgi:hypothetical protein
MQTAIHSNAGWKARIPRVMFAGGVVLLGLSWYVLFRWFAAATQFLLVPTTIYDGGFPAGDWQRVANDFFATVPGANMLGSLVCMTSAALFCARLLHAPGKGLVPWVFAASIITFLVGATVAIFALSWGGSVLRGPLPSGTFLQASYVHQWPEILAFFLLTIGFIVVQIKMPVADVQPPRQ